MHADQLDAQIKEIPGTAISFVFMRGTYDQMPTGFTRLYGWTAALGLKPSGEPMAVYLTDPSKTAEFDAEWELWAPVEGEVTESGPNEKGLGVKVIDEMTVATTTHRGPYDGMRPTYQALTRWISDRSYVPDGPSMEVYLSDPNEVAPEDYLTEIRMPVKKVQRAAAEPEPVSAYSDSPRSASPRPDSPPTEMPPKPTSPQPTSPPQPAVPSRPEPPQSPPPRPGELFR